MSQFLLAEKCNVCVGAVVVFQGERWSSMEEKSKLAEIQQKFEIFSKFNLVYVTPCGGINPKYGRGCANHTLKHVTVIPGKL